MDCLSKDKTFKWTFSKYSASGEGERLTGEVECMKNQE